MLFHGVPLMVLAWQCWQSIRDVVYSNSLCVEYIITVWNIHTILNHYFFEIWSAIYIQKGMIIFLVMVYTLEVKSVVSQTGVYVQYVSATLYSFDVTTNLKCIYCMYNISYASFNKHISVIHIHIIKIGTVANYH